MLNKTTASFNRVVETRGDITRADSDLTQLGVSYRGSCIIGEDDIRNATFKVSGYNKDSETAACPRDRAPEVPSLIHATGEHRRERWRNNTLQHFLTISSPSHHSVIVFAKKYEEDLAVALSSVIKRLPVGPQCSYRSETNVNELGSIYDKVLLDSGGHAYAGYSLAL